MENAHPAAQATEATTKNALTRTQWALLIPTAIATAIAGAWPVGDLIYRKAFDPPATWWVLFLMTLAGWIMFMTELRQEKSRLNQQTIIDSQATLMTILEEVQAEMAEVRAEMEGYGDARERAGHALAAAIRGNGNGPVRQLHTVE